MARKPVKKKPTKKLIKFVKAARPTVRKPKHQDDTAPALGRPKLLRRPPKLTAKELLSSVWAGDKERSTDIAVKQAKRIRTPKALPGYIVYRVATLNKENRHIHRVTLLFDGKVSTSAKVIVDDDTFRHVFFYEYALAKRGNAFIYRSNGEAPQKTNPRLKPGISKHTFVALRYILRAKRAGELK